MPTFFVSDGNAYAHNRAPNPRCCSDAGVLCPDCARQILNTGIAANAEGDYDRSDILVPPTLADLLREEQGQSGPTLNVDPSVDYLPLPVMNYGKETPCGCRSRNSPASQHETEDYLPLPRML